LRIAAISQVLRIAGVDARPQSLALRYSKTAGQKQDCHRGVQTLHSNTPFSSVVEVSFKKVAMKSLMARILMAKIVPVFSRVPFDSWRLAPTNGEMG
jgi:hypothetical protein